ncbi:zinc finger MYM-type protein 1-like [Palaemon carinicauda]|uniref:zinc finger MYM-type protein 1-like n=1 Tax=Palaemon carinicauda TaxID=392227 RepID=UPI0035B5A20B
MSGKCNELTEPDQAAEMVNQATDPDKEKAEIVMDPSGEDKEMETQSDTPLSEAGVEGLPGANDIGLWPSIISEQIRMCLLFYVQTDKLRNKKKSESSLLSSTGFCDWKHSHERLRNHEQSAGHIEATVAFNMRLKAIGRVDIELTQQVEHLEQYWRSVLKQVITVIHFSAEWGLAFRGNNESVDSPRNGNFQGILELIAKYDDFLAQDIKTEANCGKGYTNYLSSTILEEAIRIIGEQLLREIISRVKKSKYYSISLDSTPDAAQVDQLTLVLRYMEKDRPVERFVTFMANKGHGAEDMFNALMEFLKTHNLALGNSRG